MSDLLPLELALNPEKSLKEELVHIKEELDDLHGRFETSTSIEVVLSLAEVTRDGNPQIGYDDVVIASGKFEDGKVQEREDGNYWQVPVGKNTSHSNEGNKMPTCKLQDLWKCYISVGGGFATHSLKDYNITHCWFHEIDDETHCQMRFVNRDYCVSSAYFKLCVFFTIDDSWSKEERQPFLWPFFTPSIGYMIQHYQQTLVNNPEATVSFKSVLMMTSEIQAPLRLLRPKHEFLRSISQNNPPEIFTNRKSCDIVVEVLDNDGNKQQLRGLLDTGCTRSIALKHCVNKKDLRIVPEGKGITYKSYNQTFESRETATIEFKLLDFSSTKKITWECQVDMWSNKDTMPYDIIIGTDLMSELGMIIDFKTKSLKWDGMALPMGDKGFAPGTKPQQHLPGLPSSHNKQTTMSDLVPQVVAALREKTLIDTKDELDGLYKRLETVTSIQIVQDAMDMGDEDDIVVYASGKLEVGYLMSEAYLYPRWVVPLNNNKMPTCKLKDLAKCHICVGGGFTIQSILSDYGIEGDWGENDENGGITCIITYRDKLHLELTMTIDGWPIEEVSDFFMSSGFLHGDDDDDDEEDDAIRFEKIIAKNYPEATVRFDLVSFAAKSIKRPLQRLLPKHRKQQVREELKELALEKGYDECLALAEEL